MTDNFSDAGLCNRTPVEVGGVVWKVGNKTWGRYDGELVLDECRVESIDGGDTRKSPLFVMTAGIATFAQSEMGRRSRPEAGRRQREDARVKHVKQVRR